MRRQGRCDLIAGGFCRTPQGVPRHARVQSARGSAMVGRRELKWVAMIAAMETDWRTRCVGEAMDQGYTFLRLTCSCGRITDFPFPLLLRRRGVDGEIFIGNLGFRCLGNALEWLPPGTNFVTAERY